MGDEEDSSGNNGDLKPFIEPSTIKAFVAGLVIGNINKGLLLGFTIGTLGGIFMQQNFTGIPDVSRFWKDLISRWNRTK